MGFNRVGLVFCLLLSACGGGGGGGGASGVAAENPSDGNKPIQNPVVQSELVEVESCKHVAVGEQCARSMAKLISRDSSGQRLVIELKNDTEQSKSIQLVGNFANTARAVFSRLPSAFDARAISDLSGNEVSGQFREYVESHTPSSIKSDNSDLLNPVIQQQNQKVDRTIQSLVKTYHDARRHRREAVDNANLPIPSSPALYSEKTWQALQNNQEMQLNTQLQGQAGLVNGRSVNVWVADSVKSSQVADMKVTPEQAQQLANIFANQIYPYVTQLIGEPWGQEVPPSLQAAMLAPSVQDINIVLQDITTNNQPLGLVGYFASINNFLKQKEPSSNEALTFFVDAPTYTKLDGLGQTPYRALTMTTLAHEFQHMIQFYQKRIRHEQTEPAQVWQNETASQAIAYLVDRKLYPNLNDSPSLKPNGEFNQSLSYAGCVMNRWGGAGDICTSTDHYPKALSFSMYLLHQFGPDIMTDWVQNNGIGEQAILQSLSQRGVNLSLPSLLRKWGISTQSSFVDRSSYIGFPENDSNKQYPLSHVNPADYLSYRSILMNRANPMGLLSPYQMAAQRSVCAGERIQLPAKSVMDLVVLVNL